MSLHWTDNRIYREPRAGFHGNRRQPQPRESIFSKLLVLCVCLLQYETRVTSKGMSLFRAHQFWSLDLGQLQAQTSDQEQEAKSSFAVCLGQFQAIGSHQVLVCASLGGLLCIVQCPVDKQPAEVGKSPEEDQIKPSTEDKSHQQEQLLCASQLGFPIVDVSCGLFSSTMKQSVAVLSFNKLVLCQVKRQSPDLVSQDEPLLSFRFEEQLVIQLEACQELAAALLLLPGGSCDGQKQPEMSSKTHSSRQLPQRDLLLVRYTNQFLVSLIDQKRLVGHFQLIGTETDPLAEANSASLFMGVQPAAAWWHQSSSLLAIANTDNRIHCLQTDKLQQLAKQRLVQRVAQSLINRKDGDSSSAPTTNRLALDLDASSQWQFELAAGAPVQMEATTSKDSASGQLLVMSRHQVDLLSSDGQHLWSQRFEGSLLCSSSYLLPPDYGGQLMTLLCADCLSNDKSDLMLMKGQQLVWSAQLHCRPSQLWRLRLSKTRGVICCLDASQAQLSMSYLGTRLEQDAELLTANEEGAANLAQLLQLDRQLDQVGDTNSSDLTGPSLQLQVELEASGQWPQVQVLAKCHCKVASGSFNPIMGLSVLMEFDETLTFRPVDGSQMSWLSPNCVSFHLGNCWPDQVSPTLIQGYFSLRPQQVAAGVLPKSLYVKLVARFSQQQVGSRIHEDGFLLPLTLITRLQNVDQTSGQNQTLDDVMSNLMINNTADWSASDLLLQTDGDLLDLVDEFIESDLVCRGLGARQQAAQPDESLTRLVKNATITEKISLLAQSLDCRLRYKSVERPAHSPVLSQQASDEPQDIVLVSFGLEMAAGSGLLEPAHDGSAGESLWLHLCDLTPDLPGASLAEELLRRRLSAWCCSSEAADLQPARQRTSSSRAILLLLESKSPLPVLFLQSHLVKRFRPLMPSVRPVDSSAREALKRGDFRFFIKDDDKPCGLVAINESLSRAMRSIQCNYYKQVADRMIELQTRLRQEYCKFQVSTMSSVSLAKRLVNLPADWLVQFSTLSQLVKMHHNNLLGMLMELERLQRLADEHRKLPETEELLAADDADSNRWPLVSWLQLCPAEKRKLATS